MSATPPQSPNRVLETGTELPGGMELRATDAVWIDKIFIYPDLAHNLVHVKLRIRNSTGEPRQQISRWLLGQQNLTDINIGAILWKSSSRTSGWQAPLEPWSEFLPRVQALVVSMSFGFRSGVLR